MSDRLKGILQYKAALLEEACDLHDEIDSSIHFIYGVDDNQVLIDVRLLNKLGKLLGTLCEEGNRYEE